MTQPDPPNRGAQLLRRWMQASGTRQVQLGRILHVSQVTISKWLSGSTPRARTAIALRNLCDIPIEAWLEPAEPETPPALQALTG